MEHTTLTLTADDACLLFHTALRKAVDSPASSAAYSLIHIICRLKVYPKKLHPWRVFGEVIAAIPQVDKNSLEISIKRLADEWYKRAKAWRDAAPMIDRKPSDDIHSMLYGLTSTLRLLSAQDLEGIAFFMAGES